jgi:uncharacterized protein
VSRPERIAPDRIADVDALRGVALFGILLVNVHAFASAFYGAGVSDPIYDGRVDHVARALVAALFEMKFYLLFSFLFGYSVTLQMVAAERAGEPLLARMLRRQAGLLVIGLAHGTLLFYGDILTIYALLGSILLALRHRTDSSALRLAAWLVGVSAAVWLSLGLLQWASGERLNRAAAIVQALAAQEAYRADPWRVIAQRLTELPPVWATLLAIQAPCAMAMFLVGFVAGRRDLLRNVPAHRPLFRRLLWAGGAIGAPGALLYAWLSQRLGGSGWDVAGLGVCVLTAPLLSAAYGSALLLGFHTHTGRVLAGWLAPAGRMGLSNYLGQSLVCALLFTGYGFGLIGRVSPLAAGGVAVLLFALQLPLSRWWLRRFAYGPAEWLLRALTIARWPRWRRIEEAEAVG